MTFPALEREKEGEAELGFDYLPPCGPNGMSRVLQCRTLQYQVQGLENIAVSFNIALIEMDHQRY